MKFLCSQCGACCRRAYHIPELPLAADGKTCANLENNLCTIYETRPAICNVERLSRTMGKRLTKREFFVLNSLACNTMIKEDRMPAEYLIDIRRYAEA